VAIREMLDQAVRSFVDNYGGFLIVSSDSTFIRTFRALLKTLGVSPDCMYCEMNVAEYLQQLRRMLKSFKRLVLFVEASMDGKKTVDDFQRIKDVLGDRVVIICLSSEMDRDVLSLFHELGADNIIVKPVSINSIVEKIGYTIKPNDIRSLVDKAKDAISQGDYDTAKNILDRILEIKSDSSIAQILLGDIYRCHKKFQEAEQCYKKASSAARMYLEPMNKLVSLYEETGNHEAKLWYLEKMDKLSPLNHKRKIDIGDTYTQLGDAEHSVQYYKDAVRVVRKHANDQVVDSLMQVAKKIMDLHPEQGLTFMSEAIEMKTGQFTQNDMWMFNEIGINFRKQGQWEGAIDYYSRGLDVDPENGGLYFNRAMAYFQGKKYFKAKENVDEALKRSPELLENDAVVPYNIARICYYTEKYADARSYAVMTLAMNPDHKGAADLLKRLDAL